MISWFGGGGEGGGVAACSIPVCIRLVCVDVMWLGV